MIKTITTLIRGSYAEAEDALFDANASRILGQQLRDAAESMELAKRELACAMAHRASEQRAMDAIDQRKTHLEQAAIDAIGGQRDDLAAEAATMIAALEDERRARAAALARFDADIARLRKLTDDGRRRLDDLRRGLELARAQEALRRAGANGRKALTTGSGALRDAEVTLARIRDGHVRCADEHQALDDLERVQSGKDLDDRLADAGFGPNMRSKTSDVMERLRRVAAERQAGSR